MNFVNSKFTQGAKEKTTFVFECWLWFDKKPYHKECVIILSADELTYFWNNLFVDD